MVKKQSNKSRKKDDDLQRERHALLLALKGRIADLAFIRLESSSASREPRKMSSLPSDPSEGRYEIELSSHFRPADDGGWLLQFLAFDLVAFFKTFEQPILISAKYCAGFKFKPNVEPPTQQEVEALGQTVTLTLIWPYFREFVQSMTTRMGFPALPIPWQAQHIVGQWNPRPDSQADTSAAP